MLAGPMDHLACQILSKESVEGPKSAGAAQGRPGDAQGPPIDPPGTSRVSTPSPPRPLYHVDWCMLSEFGGKTYLRAVTTKPLYYAPKTPGPR